MKDFLPFLYESYIKPYADGCPKTGYEMSLSLMETELTPDDLRDYARALEFHATRAFLLGLRTGVGLSKALI